MVKFNFDHQIVISCYLMLFKFVIMGGGNLTKTQNSEWGKVDRFIEQR